MNHEVKIDQLNEAINNALDCGEKLITSTQVNISERHLEQKKIAALQFAEALSKVPALKLKNTLMTLSKKTALHEVVAPALLFASLTPKQVKVIVSRVKENNDIKFFRKFNYEIDLLTKKMFVKFPGTEMVMSPSAKAWVKIQSYAKHSTRNAIIDEGLGFAELDAQTWGKLLRGVNLEERSKGSVRDILLNLIKKKLLSKVLAEDVSKSGLLQTLLKKAYDAELICKMLCCASEVGFPSGAKFEGNHPLWLMVDIESKNKLFTSKHLEQIMDIGFGPNMELPNNMSLELTPTQRKNNNPTLVLEWAKKSKENIMEVTKMGVSRGMDLDARDNKGESLIGILNRLAGSTSNPLIQEKYEKDFFSVIQMGADPFGITADKKNENIAANDEIKAKIKAACEKKVISQYLDQSIFERAKELLETAMQEKDQNVIEKKVRL